MDTFKREQAQDSSPLVTQCATDVMKFHKRTTDLLACEHLLCRGRGRPQQEGYLGKYKKSNTLLIHNSNIILKDLLGW